MKLVKHGTKFAVVWKKNDQTHRLLETMDFCELAFKKTKCYQLGLFIELNNSEVDIMTIDGSLYCQKSFKEYSQYLRRMYIISGLLFEDEKQASMFYEEIDKKVMWGILNGSVV